MNKSKLTGIITTTFGIVYTVLSLSLPKASVGNPIEPIIFPLICGVGMTLCGFLLLITERKKWADEEKKEVKKEQKEISLDTKLIIFTCAMGILYGLLFDKIGYVLSTTLFIGSLLFALNDGLKKWKTNILVAIGFSVGIYVMFNYLLGIPLPMIPGLDI